MPSEAKKIEINNKRLYWKNPEQKRSVDSKGLVSSKRLYTPVIQPPLKGAIHSAIDCHPVPGKKQVEFRPGPEKKQPMYTID
ncbi:MAG: hypothetical protein NT030_08345, partial [Candidatus Saganbacteria bacterium]|nr:hypothetical protein [Candidatus Saganbacteria bacterium]